MGYQHLLNFEKGHVGIRRGKECDCVSRLSIGQGHLPMPAADRLGLEGEGS